MALASALLLLASALAAEVIGTMAGFGAATVLTPVAALFLDIKVAIAVVAWFHLLGNASRLVFFGRHIRWRIWAQFGLPAIACSLLGASLTARLSSAAIECWFGVFLVTYVAVEWATGGRLRAPQHPAALVAGGVGSGFIAGLLGTGGAVRAAFLVSFGLAKEAYIGTSAAIALIVDATRLPVYLMGGFIPSKMTPVAVSLIPVAFAGAWIGQRLVRRMRPVLFRILVLGMLALMGMRMLFEGFRGLT